MEWLLDVYPIGLFLAASLCWLSLAILWPQRGFTSTAALMGLALSSSMWALSYGLSLSSLDLYDPLGNAASGQPSLWPVISQLSELWFAPCYGIFVLYHHRYRLTRSSVTVLSALPLLHSLLLLSNPTEAVTALRLPSNWAVLHYSYSYVMLSLGVVLLPRTSFAYVSQRTSSGLWHWQRWEAYSYLPLAGIVSMLGISLDVFLSQPVHLAPLSASVSTALLVRYTLRHQLVNIAPVARSAVVESISQGVLVVDRAGHIVDVNQAAKNLLGLEASAILSQPAEEVFAKKQGIIGHYRDVAQTELETLRAGGRAFDIRISPLLYRQRNYGQVVVLRDVTERVEFEQELRRAKGAAEAASYAKSQFLANMSHELRTPLTAIIGFSELLMSQDLETEHHEYVQEIHQAGKHLFAIVSDVIDYATLEADDNPLEVSSFNVADLLHEAAQAAHGSIRQQGNQLSVLADDKLGTISSDRGKLARILAQLLSNAGKFTHEGQITLAAKRRLGRKGIEIKVIDTGIGIAPEHLHSIFTAFRQIDESYTRRYGGSGLGLALCERLCKQLGGSIVVESRLGEGSSFTVRIPEDPQQAL